MQIYEDEKQNYKHLPLKAVSVTQENYKLSFVHVFCY